MCDICCSLLELFERYDRDNPNGLRSPLVKTDIFILCSYVQAWNQRQCTCCYKEPQSFDKFNAVIQGLLQTVLELLRRLPSQLGGGIADSGGPRTPTESKASGEQKGGGGGGSSEGASSSAATITQGGGGFELETWSPEDQEKLLHFTSKAFLLNFPLYVAFKHSVHSKLEEVSQSEVTALSSVCDMNDLDIPVHLLRNVAFFCGTQGGLSLLTACFRQVPANRLPIGLAHALVSLVSNLKLWMNLASIVQHLVPLRSAVIKYLCSVCEGEVRGGGSRSLFELMLGAVKDPLDVQVSLDREGLELAFRCFTSPTLTMRLSGIAQINSHISMYQELCHSETLAGAQTMGRALASWLVEYRVVEHLFGPNLHVEVIKQSQLVLNLLASEGRLTPQHLDAMWSATQLKHCGRQVLDLLAPLIRSLHPLPARHLYARLCATPPREHNEQTLLLASSLIKYLWASAGGRMPSSLDPEDRGSPFTLIVRGQLHVPPELRRVGKKPFGTRGLKGVTVDGSEDDDEEEDEDDDEGLFRTPRGQLQTVAGAAERPPVGESSSESPGSSPARMRGVPGRRSLHPWTPHQHPPARDDDEEEEESGMSGGEEEEEEESEEELSSEEEARHTTPEQATVHPPPPPPILERVLTEPALTTGHAMAALQGRTNGKALEDDPKTESNKARASVDSDNKMGNGSSASLPRNTSGKPDDAANVESKTSNVSEHRNDVQSARHSGADGHARVSSPSTVPQRRDTPPALDVEQICQPGNTLLWDLLQDGKIEELGEELALEAEKILCSLVCWSLDKMIRMKFIEGCLHNLANSRSVVVSLRLLPKLLGSFQQFREGIDTHYVTMWAEREHRMMQHFLNDLVNYMATHRDGKATAHKCYSHTDQIQVRLHFLSCVFSTAGSPDSFRLNQEQLDVLWSCLALDPECSNELFSWLLNQVRSREQHALGADLFKHLLLQKLPQLPAATTSMTALNLLQQLSSQAQEAASACGINQLWEIALKALSTDVSMAAIQYLNNFYFNVHHGTLEHEEEFIQRCMKSLSVASDALSNSPQREEITLMVVQRALQLLKMHLEAFLRRYAFHLRRWALQEPHHGTGGQLPHLLLLLPHRAAASPAAPTPTALEGGVGTAGTRLRVVCQPAGLPHKITLELQSNDFVADLRAEVSHWWEKLEQASQIDSDLGGPVPSCSSPGLIRMITQGQELTTDLDEKTLSEVGFKDHQLVFVSVGAARNAGRKRVAGGDGVTGGMGPEAACLLPCPARDRLPTLLLLRPAYLDQLFALMQQLGNVRTRNRAGEPVLHTKAQVLSRRVWEILTMLPTSPAILRDFVTIAKDSTTESTAATMHVLLNPEVPQKLLYSLQIVESLRQQSMRPSATLKGRKATPSNSNVEASGTHQTWAEKFVACGGLRHLFDIFASGVLHPREGEEWNEWAEDCLACLLRVIYHFGLESGQGIESPTVDEVPDTALEASRKRAKRHKKGSVERLVVPKLNQVLLDMLGSGEKSGSEASDQESSSLERLLSGALGAGTASCDPHQLRTGFWGRAHVVHCAMRLLASWAHSRPTEHLLLQPGSRLDSWLKQLVLDDPDPAVRREACTGLYRLCLGVTTDGKSGQSHVGPLLASLLGFLPAAQNMKLLHPDEGEKEPFGPGCRDYFFLACQLVDNLDDEVLPDQRSLVDLDALSAYLAEAILTRDIREARHDPVEDDGLYGLLSLATSVAKHNPPFKVSKEGQEFVLGVFECLFAVPSGGSPPGQRLQPKCKSSGVRSAAYDLLVELVRGAPDNFRLLHAKLLQQHSAKSHSPYPWDYWPHEDGRSECGYVGLTNLGATCYLASCMQHLYMMPQARASILSAKMISEGKHGQTLRELQRMFAYLLESERKAYNPRSFCKAYTMDHQPLNTGEQKDMAEFFTDLISKLEEMTPQLKELVKTLFCGVLSNNVVSLDCAHISRTVEEFYTLRCQVADMRNLYESMDELTVKDTLEGDNMYTCSQCGKKVRAEKRACIKKLPRILCFNTMRYTFNMVTMMKEKVNTHFSFPLHLDMSNYMEHNLLPSHKEPKEEPEECYDYDLIGVTVHTGTADGGHYYSFIRERQNPGKDKWFLFNDAEVKPFDPSHIAAECFGGEMTSKTYDSVTDKFMDFSFEKTNSAYMLFYERRSGTKESEGLIPRSGSMSGKLAPVSAEAASEPNASSTFQLSPELAEWIWQDNMQFLQDKSIFDHTYFNFLYQICGCIPQTFPSSDDITLLSAKLGTSFVLETLIHAKEKPTIAQWIELLTKQFNASQSACEWFLDHMAEDEWWPIQILIKCPNQVVRQLFQRLCIHVINQLQPCHSALYLQPYPDSDDSSDVDLSQIGRYSCVTRFVKKLLSLIEHGAKQHLKHLTEYFAFLLEFAKMGEAECQFLLSIEAVSTIIAFYLGHKADYVEMVSEDEEEEEEEEGAGMGGGGGSGAPTKYRPPSLDKMLALVLLLVEKSRGQDHRLQLSQTDYNALTGGKGFPFLFQQVRDNICLRQTCNLIFSLCRWNDHLAPHIVNMLFSAITKQPEVSSPFFKLLSMLVEFVGGPPGMPAFTSLVLQRIWEAAEYCPLQCLEWLTLQVPRNKVAHSWVLQSMDAWVEKYLIAHALQRVRNVAALLLVSLVPSSHFRQAFRSGRNGLAPQKDVPMAPEAVMAMHQIYEFLLRLLKKAKLYIDPAVHGTAKLMYYFAVLTYCLVGKQEKLMFSPYFLDLWNLFQPGLSEPAIPVHHNKQTLLLFWYQVSVDCVENIKLIVQNPHVTKNIAFNYILADHDDQDVVVFNRCMLPAYYGLLRLCCQQSRPFARQLAQHQNIQWAFKNITPYTTLYTAAIGELLKLMELFVCPSPGATEQEQREVTLFKRTTLSLYLGLDPRVCWATLVAALRVLVQGPHDRLFVLANSGLPVLFQALHTLHVMYHEATACHVTGDLADLLSLALDLLRTCTAMQQVAQESRSAAAMLRTWPELGDTLRRLLTLLNTYVPPQVRLLCLDVLKELVMLQPRETVTSIVPLLASCHSTFLESSGLMTTGPYFPRRGQKGYPTKSAVRPQRPILQMFLHLSQLEASKGVDAEYDQALLDFFLPYHRFVETVFRAAIGQNIVTQDLVNLSAMVSIEGIPLHIDLIPKLWLEVLEGDNAKEFGEFLRNSSYVTNCVSAVLLEERGYLNNPMVFRLFSLLVPKVGKQVLKESVTNLILSRAVSLVMSDSSGDVLKHARRITADLRATLLVLLVQKNSAICPGLAEYLDTLEAHCKDSLHPKEEGTSSVETAKTTEETTSNGEEIGDPGSDNPPPKKPRSTEMENGETNNVTKPSTQPAGASDSETVRVMLETVKELQTVLAKQEQPSSSMEAS
ncbi:ubiquitin carboxyl-terminal hydrolase 34-like isoform X1 [Ornithodoros turicata]|uniref:ubiquitin carboxyl-terminal hydrolase 34-like isoform X1 n=1 Tax=Ornithodoros turicata TaxID=34597 RepID=UPI00313A33AC